MLSVFENRKGIIPLTFIWITSALLKVNAFGFAKSGFRAPFAFDDIVDRLSRGRGSFLFGRRRGLRFGRLARRVLLLAVSLSKLHESRGMDE